VRQWTRRLVTALGALLAGALIATPFFVHKDFASKGLWMVNTHDMIQHLAVMKDFDKVLKSGVIYPRWLSDINNGYGIPWMNFYPPGFYYAASFVNAVFNDWTKTLFAISILGFAASGLAFYWLAREFCTRTASAIAALFYRSRERPNTSARLHQQRGHMAADKTGSACDEDVLSAEKMMEIVRDHTERTLIGTN